MKICSIFRGMQIKWTSLVTHTVRNPPVMQETWVRFLGWEDTLEKRMATHSIFLPGEYHGQRSLAGYYPCCLSQESNKV